MIRVLSIWLPSLAAERWSKASDCAPESPVVLTVEGTHGPIIYAVTKAAAARGARAGARLTDARAIEPSLIAVPADPQGDQALLRRLARWAQRWSPLVEIDGPDGLRLDVTGVAHLFGGEEALAEEVRDRLAATGLTARVAIAPTAAAAWALSRFSQSSANAVCTQHSADMDASLCWHDELKSLHVSALRLNPDTVRTLERLGLKTVGALAALPRLALARRFCGAEDVVDALDRALGRKPEPLTAAPTETAPRATLRLEEPATHLQAAPQALERLIPKLVVQLEERHLGARRLTLTGFCIDGSTAQASVATTIPSREPKHLARLLADKAAALDPGFGFDAFALEADWTETLGAAQASLVEEPSGERDLARLVDRLSVKLGPGRVRRPQARKAMCRNGRAGGLRPFSPPLQGRGVGVG
jgi:protein ImuB